MRYLRSPDELPGCALSTATTSLPGAWGAGRQGMSRLLFGGLTSLIARLPAWLGYALADLATGLHWACFPGRRHAALANLPVTPPRASRRARARIARRMMRSYNRMMYEFFRLPHLSREQVIAAVDLVGREHLERAIA